MIETRVLAATGMLGSGFLETSFQRGVSLKPQVIACDSGSTDAGPAHLGGEIPYFNREVIKRDFRLMLLGRNVTNAKLIIGSCGMAGGDWAVDWMRDIAMEIAREEKIHFKLALIKSEQDKNYLYKCFDEKRITSLYPSFDITKKHIEECTHIVGVMGKEPIEQALTMGADVILAGRTTDTSIYATVPIMNGCGEGPSWHAAKILECGTACTIQRKRPDSIFAYIREDHFDIEPLDLDARCTPQSVASHTLYENADPYLIKEPDGTLNTLKSKYEEIDHRTVRVFGSTYEKSDDYTIKIEGAKFGGYQTVIIAGVREPFIIRQVDSWLKNMTDKFKDRVKEMSSGTILENDYDITIKVYGRDGVMGKLEPNKNVLNHELCLLFIITAKSEVNSKKIAKSFAHFALHFPIPEWQGLISGLAFPFSPSEIYKGEVYHFNLNHVVRPSTPLEMFRTEMMEI